MPKHKNDVEKCRFTKVISIGAFTQAGHLNVQRLQTHYAESHLLRLTTTEARFLYSYLTNSSRESLIFVLSVRLYSISCNISGGNMSCCEVNNLIHVSILIRRTWTNGRIGIVLKICTGGISSGA